MGNSFACFSPKGASKVAKQSTQLPSWVPKSGKPAKTFSTSSSKRENNILDESFIKEQAMIATMLYKQHMQSSGDLNIPRSVSVKDPLQSSMKPKKLPKRSRSVSESTPQSLQLINQYKGNEGSATEHFVLVHGGGFGAWCWYKIIALLKDGGHKVHAIDLTGSGVDSSDINNITTLAQYAKPLTEFLDRLPEGNKVILVGHDLGGACISYAMELYPRKVSKAIFVAATMLNNGQSALDIFSQQSCMNELSRRAQKFIYASGESHSPTAIDLDKSLIEELLFNKTPTKDIALASVSMRPVPFAPVKEKLFLTKANYFSIPRFYIKTEEDFALPVVLQEAMVISNSPQQVFQLKGSDHSPFFSKPQALHRLLVEISDVQDDTTRGKDDKKQERRPKIYT